MLFYIFLLSNFLANAQGRSEIGVSFTKGENDLVMFQLLEGAASHYGRGFYGAGFHYFKSLNSWLDFETSIDFGYHKISIEPAFIGITVEPIRDEIFLTSLPFKLRAIFLKFFFVNAGVLIDWDFFTSQYLDNQTGFGATLGIGAAFRFKSGVGLFVTPNLKAHSLIPFSLDEYHERLLESSFQFGVSYKLK